MSRVFVAEDTSLGRRVVVKVLPSELAQQVNIERFRREIQLAASLQHPCIVPLLAAGVTEGLPYYTMPLVEGETLRARIARSGELPVADTAKILSDVCSALSHAHAHGVVHRDIKPDNILLSGGFALVTDFGVAKALSASTARDGAITSLGVALGTAAYMAPEQAAADPATDHRADIYALGAIAYEMLTGHQLFPGRPPQAVLAAHSSETPTPVQVQRPATPAALAALVMRCLEKHPADRPQNAEEALHALEALTTTSAGHMPVAASIPGTVASWRSRFRSWLRPATVIGALGLGALVAGTWYYRSRPEAGGPPPGIAVLPFRVASPDLALWREGIVDLLSLNLDGAGGLRRVDPGTLLSRWRRDIPDKEEVTDADRALGVARSVGARFAVLGSIVGRGPAVRLSAEVYDLDRGTSAGATQSEGPADSLPELVDRLSLQILRSGLLGDPSAAAHFHVSAFTTTSLPALKAYLEGEQQYRRARPVDAIAKFRRAVDADSTFALALYRLSVAQSWTISPHYVGADADEGRYFARAARFARRLPPREALLVRGYEQMTHGQTAAIGTLEQLTARYPDDAERWFQLGEAYFHLGGAALTPRDRFRQALRRGLELDPTFAPGYLHLIEDAFDRLDSAEVRRLLERIRAIDPSGPKAVGMFIARALVWGDSAARRQARAMLDTASAIALLTGKHAIDATPELSKVTLTIALALARGARHPLGPRAQAYSGAMYGYLERGHLRDAQLLTDDIRALSSTEAWPTVVAHQLTLYTRLYDYPISTAPRAVDALTRMGGDTLEPVFLGMMAALEGRAQDVRRYTRDLDSIARVEAARGDTADADHERAWARAILALAAAHRGDSPSLRGLESAVPALRGFELWAANMRYQLGKLLLAAGRAREARAYLESLDLSNNGFGVAPIEFQLGRASEALADTARAIHHYSRFARWWADCDPELRPWREEAIAGVARLTHEPRSAGVPAPRP